MRRYINIYAVVPIQLNENPDAHNDAVFPWARTVFANVRITPDITDNIIWHHQLTHAHDRKKENKLPNLIIHDGWYNS